MRGTITRYFIFLAAGILSISCENSMQEVNEQFRKKTAIEEAYGVDGYLSQQSTVKARLTAPYMKRYLVDSPYVEFPNSMHVDFFNDSALVESTVDALYARQMETDRKVLLRDSVVVINKNKGDTLRTPELWWDQNKEEFTTDKNVRIFQKDKVIFGVGLRAKQDFTEYWIYRITGTVEMPPNGMPQ